MKRTEFFSINIRRLRDEKDWSQMKLADESNVSIQTIFRAESKNVIPRGKNIEKIAAALGVEAYVLFSDPDVKINNEQSFDKQTIQLISEMSVKAAGELLQKESLTEEEKELLNILRGFSDKDRRRVIVDTARRLANVKDRQTTVRRMKAR